MYLGGVTGASETAPIAVPQKSSMISRHTVTHMSDSQSVRLCRLQIQLQDRRSANVLCIKLISHEDRMHEWHDEHDTANIDMNHVQCIGKLVHMPLGVQLGAH